MSVLHKPKQTQQQEWMWSQPCEHQLQQIRLSLAVTRCHHSPLTSWVPQQWVQITIWESAENFGQQSYKTMCVMRVSVAFQKATGRHSHDVLASTQGT
jgi:hypothetical protein